MAEKDFPEEVVREAIKNSRESLIARLPIPTFLTRLECKRIISEHERSLITVGGTTDFHQRGKLVDTLLTKDGRAIMKALDILKTQECGYADLVDKILADMGKMQQVKSRKSAMTSADRMRVETAPVQCVQEFVYDPEFIKELQEKCDQLKATLSRKHKEAMEYQAKHHAKSKTLKAVSHTSKPVSNGSGNEKKADKEESNKELTVQHQLVKQNNEALEEMCQFKIQKYQESQQTIAELQKQLEAKEAEVERLKAIIERMTSRHSAASPHVNAIKPLVVTASKTSAVVAPKESPKLVTSKAHAVAMSTIPQHSKKAFDSKQALAKESGQHKEEASHKTPQHFKLWGGDENSEEPGEQVGDVGNVPICKKCGQIFPKHQMQRFWEHMSKCSGSEVPAGTTRANTAQSPTMGRRVYGKSATTEDLHRARGSLDMRHPSSDSLPRKFK